VTYCWAGTFQPKNIKMEILVTPVATVRNSRKEPVDDFWGEIISEIVLSDNVPEEALLGISGFSHLEIIYYFNKVNDNDVVWSGRPRGNPLYPVSGIFAQRKKDRPNRIGLCKVELLEQKGKTLLVKNLDAIDGTPVLDIKPCFDEYELKKPSFQPAWVKDLMKNYWK